MKEVKNNFNSNNDNKLDSDTNEFNKVTNSDIFGDILSSLILFFTILLLVYFLYKSCG